VSLQTRGSTSDDEEVVHVRRDGARIDVRLTRKQSVSRSPLHDMYNVDLEKYNLHRNYEFPEKVRGLIPLGNPTIHPG